MSRINNLIKWVVFQINITTSLSGWFTIAMAFYFLFANWGDLDPSFFTGIGVTFLLIGILILSISWIACTGIRNQGKFFGVVTGRKMLITYQIILCIGIIGLFSMASLALNYISDLNKASKFIKLNGISASATQFELTVAAKFNLFFFGASSICDSTAYQWFWDIVNQNCPPNYLSQVLCQKCADYSITGCFADELICNDSGGMFGEACPYSLCRAGIINFFLKHLKNLGVGAMIIIFFVLLVVSLNCLLVCYTKRDSVEQVLYKTGTITRKPDNIEKQHNNTDNL